MLKVIATVLKSKKEVSKNDGDKLYDELEDNKFLRFKDYKRRER